MSENPDVPDEDEKEKVERIIQEMFKAMDKGPMRKAILAVLARRVAEQGPVSPLDVILEKSRIEIYEATKKEWEQVVEGGPQTPWLWTMDNVLAYYWEIVWGEPWKHQRSAPQ
jgi:hypothetical protein